MSNYSLSRFTSPNAGVAVSTAGNDVSTTAALGQAVQNMDQNAIKDPGGSDGQVLTRSGGTWTAASLPSQSSASVALTSAVNLSSADTGFDIVSLSLAAGTWLLIGTASCLDSSTNSHLYTIRLWDGTTGYGSGCGWEASGNGTGVAANASVTLGSTTTVKMTAYAHSGTTGRVVATPTNGSTNTGTVLSAVRIP